MFKKLKEFRDEWKELSKILAQEATVLGTTLAKAFVSPKVFESLGDAVVVDEEAWPTFRMYSLPPILLENGALSLGTFGSCHLSRLQQKLNPAFTLE